MNCCRALVVPGLDPLRQLHLLLGRQQGDVADVLQVLPDGVLARPRVRGLGGGRVRRPVAHRLQVVALVQDLDPGVLQGLPHGVEGLHRGLAPGRAAAAAGADGRLQLVFHLHQGQDLLLVDEALLLPLLQEGLEGGQAVARWRGGRAACGARRRARGARRWPGALACAGARARRRGGVWSSVAGSSSCRCADTRSHRSPSHYRGPRGPSVIPATPPGPRGPRAFGGRDRRGAGRLNALFRRRLSRARPLHVVGGRFPNAENPNVCMQDPGPAGTTAPWRGAGAPGGPVSSTRWRTHQRDKRRQVRRRAWTRWTP